MILGFYRLKKAHSRPEICFIKDLYKKEVGLNVLKLGI